MRTLDKDKIRYSFLFCALWCKQLEGKYSVNDFLSSAVTKANHIIEGFISLTPKEALKVYCDHFSERLLEEDPESQLGHDLWLSINGHGAGFFDHHLGGVEDILQNVCREMRDSKNPNYYINQVWVNELEHICIE